MTDNILYQQAMSGLFWKLENVLRGDAFLVKENNTLTDEERKARMKAIEQFLTYIRAYEENTKLLAEYKDLKERMIDDGR